MLADQARRVVVVPHHVERRDNTVGTEIVRDVEQRADEELIGRDTFGRYRLSGYQRTVQNFCQRLKEFCQKRGIRFFSCTSDTSLEKLLLKQLREAEVWG